MFVNLAKYFKLKHFEIHLLSLKNFVSLWEPGYPFDKKLIDKLYLYDFAQPSSIIRKSLFERAKNKARKLICDYKKPERGLHDYATVPMKEFMKQIVQRNRYSHILIAYAYWANLINDPFYDDIHKIISINDFLTLQIKSELGKDDGVSQILKEEVDRINLFDTAISVSEFEYNFFSQVATHPSHHFVPIFIETPLKVAKKPKYDIGFVGFTNYHNITGINWFLKEVWPHLNGKKMIIVGKVVERINRITDKNIAYVPKLENIKDLYENVRLTVCPLFSGSGLKVKIIESLSYGTPVICTTNSSIGFPDFGTSGCVIADSSNDFVKAINHILNNNNGSNSISEKSLAYFNQYFSAKTAYSKLDSIFTS